MSGHHKIEVATCDLGECAYELPTFIVAADFDKDRPVDIATSNFGDSFRGECMSVLYGCGDGGFGFPQVYYGMFSLDFGAISGIEAPTWTATNGSTT